MQPVTVHSRQPAGQPLSAGFKRPGPELLTHGGERLAASAGSHLRVSKQLVI